MRTRTPKTMAVPAAVFAKATAIVIMIVAGTPHRSLAFSPSAHRSVTLAAGLSGGRDRLSRQLSGGAITSSKSRVTQVAAHSRLGQVASVTAGTVATFALHEGLVKPALLSSSNVMTPVMASGITSVLGSLFLPIPLAVGTLCGSFAGMASHLVVPTFPAAVVLGLWCGLCLGAFDRREWLVARGGRLGAVALLACASQFVVLRQRLLPAQILRHLGRPSSLAYLYDGGVYSAMTARQVLNQAPPIMLWTVAGALFMQLWKHQFSVLGRRLEERKASQLPTTILQRLGTPVAAVGVTGLLASLLVNPQVSAAAGPIYCGAFVAMAAPTVVPRWWSLVATSCYAGIAQVLMAGVFLGGWGGKLGTAALLGVWTYEALQALLVGPAKNVTA